MTKGTDLTDERRCPSCNKIIGPEAAFCPYCGSRIDERLCPSCDGVVGDDAVFCLQCGASLEEAPPELVESKPQVEEPEAEDAKSGRGKWLLQRCGIILAVIAVGFTVWMVVADGDESESSRSTSTDPRTELCSSQAEREYLADLSLHYEVFTLAKDEVRQAVFRLEENTALIFDSTWREDFVVGLAGMAAATDKMAYLDAPSSLYEISKAARRVALEIKLASFMLVAAIDDLDVDEAEEALELWVKVPGLVQEMLDTWVRLCGS